jgi:hypothetical protein
MEKKMYKYTTSQTENLKNNKKQKEIKFLTNYIPIKKTHAQSNISEYETEQSIQKNFSNKCQKNKPNTQARSVQTTHNNQFSPKKIFNVNKSNRNFTNASRSSKGSFYNLNNLNIYDYFSEKVILTQKKCIDYKTNKINTLQKQITLLKQEINMYEKKANNSKNRMTQNTSKNNIINSSQLVPKILYVNKTNNKYLLVNNNSYMSLNTFGNNDLNNEGENADKKLEKHLSNLLTENNSDNNLKCKNNINVKNASANNDTNKKKLLSIIYQSKKGCYNHNNNNYDHNTNAHNSRHSIKNNNNDNDNNNKLNNKKENLFKINHLDKEINHNLYFFSKKINEKQIQLMDNKNEAKEKIFDHENDNIKLDKKYQTLNDRINKLFNCYFDYYNKNNNSQSM